MNQKAAVPLPLLIAVIGVIAILSVLYIAPFKNSILNTTNPKEESHAAEPTLTIIFDDIGFKHLSGVYPTGVINWGDGFVWHTYDPVGLFTTYNVSYNDPGDISMPFDFVTPRKLISFEVYNQGNRGPSTTVTISCSGNPTVSQAVPAQTKATITTNWNNPCTTVDLASTNGWDARYDNFVVDATGLPSPSPSPSPTPTPTPQSGPVFGNNAQGSTFDTNDVNHINASRFLRGTAGNVSAVSVYIGSIGTAPNNQYQLAIYSDSNSLPNTLIASSAVGTLTANAWNTLPISANLSANTWYWLAFNTNGTSQQLNNGSVTSNYPGGFIAFKTQTFGTYPQTFGVPTFSTLNSSFSIYATIGGSTTSPSPSAQASTIPSPSPSPSPLPSASAKPGDIDGNNKVDIFDYNTLLTNFGKTGSGVPGDFDNNGKVDIFDFNILLTNFGK